MKHAPRKLANLTQMRARWREELISHLFDFLLPVIVAVIAFSVVLTQWVPDWNGSFQETALTLVAIGIPMAGFGIFVLVGPMPTQRDVEKNRALRRSFGMSDEIEPEE